jgi:phosphoserine phosphatase RsbU/P
MVCPNCKRELTSVENFCPYCGAALPNGTGQPKNSREERWSKAGRRPDGNHRRSEGARDFWKRMSEGLTLHVLWEQFTSEARESYSVYTRELDWEALKQEKPFRRFLKIGRALFWAMVMKLSPARRVLLLIALVLAVMDFPASVSVNTGHGVERLVTVNIKAILAFGAFFVLLALELADRVIMKRDLEIAREIQGWLVPKIPPEVEGLDIAFATRPANTVAGDYYDAFLRQRADGAAGPPEAGSLDRLLLVVADVAGKSVPAALLMATFQASLRTIAAAPVALEELVERLNNYACQHSLGGLRFTTAFFAELDPKTLALNYINAGHNPPILRRSSNEMIRLEEGGLPLGVRAEARYGVGAAELGHGDLLAVLTDGVVEAENDQGEEYGETRLLALLGGDKRGSAADELGRLMASVDAFVGSARQHDDITCLLVRAT